MPSIFQYGDVAYDIDDMKIAAWLGDGTYGTMIDIPAINRFNIEFVMKSQTGNGDGRRKLTASAIEAANVSMRNFGIPAQAIPILFGSSNDEYNPGADAYSIQDFVAGQEMPYFGALIRSFDSESPVTTGHHKGGTLLFVPKIKVMANFSWTFEYNTFIQPEMTGSVLDDDTLPANVAGFSRFVRRKVYKRDLPLIGQAGALMPL